MAALDLPLPSLADADPVARSRGLAEPILAAADEIERTRRLPEPLLTQLHAARLFRILLPRAFGGDEAEPGVYFRAVIEVGRADASVAWNMFVGNSAALIAPFIEPDSAREIFGDPRALIAWGPTNACTATAAPGGYRVSGRWGFASGCRQATWMGAHCHVVEADGSLRLNAQGRPTIRTLLFPASRAELIDDWRTVGLRGTASDSYALTDLFVPEAFSGTREDPALRRQPGKLYAFTMQGLYAVGVAGVAIGCARAMFDEFVALALRKAPRGLARLADNAVVQADVARCEARLGAAEAYMLATLDDIYARAGAAAPIDVPDRARVRLATTNAIQAALEVADHAYRAAGVDAIFAGSPFERRFRDIHTLSQQIQSRLSHYEAVGQAMLGAPSDPFY